MTIAIIGAVVLAIILLQGRIYRRFWRSGLTASVNFSAKEAFEGDGLTLNQEFTNKKLLPLPWVLVELRLSQNLVFEDGRGADADAGVQRDLFSIKIYERIRRKLPFICSRRGFYTLKEVGVSCSDLLQTGKHEGYFGTYKELTVFPRLLEEDRDIVMLYKNLDAAMLSNALSNPDPFEFKGIRDYMPHDSLKDINFKATAISQSLMVNIHAPVDAKRLEIVLNLQAFSNHAYREVYEQGIRLAATLATHYINQDVQVGFFTNGRNNFAQNITRIHMGQSAAHLYAILSALAHINTANVPMPLAKHLETINKPDAVYIIISSYYGEDLEAELARMKDAGVSYMVVMPVERRHAAKAPVSDKILVWEATD
ncbi:MAG: DUF58 domain-containing protein [Clostridiales bacterium]|jgi:uncharacterized protein (DUF58 family)|nr:DUF58 domain-containing protein [Clostridiales bacterium]